MATFCFFRWRTRKKRNERGWWWPLIGDLRLDNAAIKMIIRFQLPGYVDIMET